MAKLENRMSYICSILAFLLSLIFVALFLITGLYLGAFNEKTILSKINESNYYNEVQQELNKNAESIVLKAGLPVSVLENVVTLERVYISGKYYIETALKGSNTDISTEKLRNLLSDNINQYLLENNVDVDKDLTAGVDEIISRVEQEYKRSIQLEFINSVADYKIRFIQVTKIVLPFIVIVAGLLSYLLVRVNKYIHRGLRYIAYAVMASTIVNTIIALALLLTKSFQKINVKPKYYYNFLVQYFKWDIQIYLYLSIVGIIVSTLLISFVKLKRQNLVIYGK
jgi:hypothetical protein